MENKIFLVTINGVWAVQIVKITFDEKDALETAEKTLENETDDYNAVVVTQYTLDTTLYNNARDIYKNIDSGTENHCKIIYDKRKENNSRRKYEN